MGWTETLQTKATVCIRDLILMPLFFSQNIPYPSVRPQPDGSQEIKLPEGPYGVPDVMLNG